MGGTDPGEPESTRYRMSFLLAICITVRLLNVSPRVFQPESKLKPDGNDKRRIVEQTSHFGDRKCASHFIVPAARNSVGSVSPSR